MRNQLQLLFLQELHTYPAHIPLAPPEYGKRGSWHLVPEDNKVQPDKEHTGMALHPHCKNNHSKPMGFFSLQRARSVQTPHRKSLPCLPGAHKYAAVHKLPEKVQNHPQAYPPSDEEKPEAELIIYLNP